ncbi:Uncharacterized protein TCM_041283 [Theobroma cacao]|uniref:Secreted protein n=1 Tax=Theobroma cacao TaxID=3641 RepID=A0A061GU08_THECC|nr:Uncharacterized protein TCM_041283 [Theobroma cacao]
MGKRYLIVILFMARLSTHILHEPSFLGANKAGQAQGLLLSRTRPFSNNSSTCLCTSARCIGGILYAGRFGNAAPGTKSIACWMLRKGGRLFGKSSLNNSPNSFNNC